MMVPMFSLFNMYGEKVGEISLIDLIFYVDFASPISEACAAFDTIEKGTNTVFALNDLLNFERVEDSRWIHDDLISNLDAFRLVGKESQDSLGVLTSVVLQRMTEEIKEDYQSARVRMHLILLSKGSVDYGRTRR